MEGLETLLVYTKNLISFPDEKKYRKVKTSNIHYQERLGHLQGAGDAMNAIGYVESGDYLRLNEAKINKKVSMGERRSESRSGFIYHYFLTLHQ